MTTREEIFNKVKSVLTGAFELPESKVTLTAHLYQDLGLDSLDAVDLAVRLKADTGLVLTEGELRSMRTVTDIVEMIHAKLNPASPNEK